jgi:hypothetical protein
MAPLIALQTLKSAIVCGMQPGFRWFGKSWSPLWATICIGVNLTFELRAPPESRLAREAGDDSERLAGQVTFRWMSARANR